MAEPGSLEMLLLEQEFPPNSLVVRHGTRYIVIGWTDTDVVILGPLSVPMDYAAAYTGRIYVPASHLREASHG